MPPSRSLLIHAPAILVYYRRSAFSFCFPEGEVGEAGGGGGGAQRQGRRAFAHRAGGDSSPRERERGARAAG